MEWTSGPVPSFKFSEVSTPLIPDMVYWGDKEWLSIDMVPPVDSLHIRMGTVLNCSLLRRGSFLIDPLNLRKRILKVDLYSRFSNPLSSSSTISVSLFTTLSFGTPLFDCHYPRQQKSNTFLLSLSILELWYVRLFVVRGRSVIHYSFG